MKKFIFLIAILVISCKENTEKKSQTIVQPEEEIEQPTIDYFTVRLTAKLEQNDKLSLYYAEELNNAFSEKKRLMKNISGSNDFQEIDFVVKDSTIIPSRVRLHFSNKNQKKVNIKSVKFLYKKNNYNLPDSTFTKFFAPNKHIEYSPTIGEFNLISKDGKYQPYFVSRPVLAYELEIL